MEASESSLREYLLYRRGTELVLTRPWGREEGFQILGVLVELEAFHLAFLIININLVRQNANFETTVRLLLYNPHVLNFNRTLSKSSVVKA